MKALITGITGQDGSYLAELLLSKGYEVYGIVRRTSQQHYDNISNIINKIKLYNADMTDSISLFNVIKSIMPDEIYNFAGMSQVRISYDSPVSTIDINTVGFLRLIEAVRLLNLDAKIYQACSSEMFGRVQEIPQNEKTPFYPRSPYGVSKAAAYYLARTFREGYNMKIYCGWLFNHESPRRGKEFVTRKICVGIADILSGKKDKLVLGNLEAKRDFGYAKEYVEWIYNIMQYHKPDDFVIATGETHSIKEFLIQAFKYAGIDNWEKYVEYDKSLYRPAEVDLLLGDATKSKELLGFEPKVKFNELVNIMMQAELDKINNIITTNKSYITEIVPANSDNRRDLYEFRIHDKSWKVCKYLKIKEDCIIGDHFHNKKDELFILLSGEAIFSTNNGNDKLITGFNEIYVPRNTYHKFDIKKGSELICLATEQFDENDELKLS